MRVMIISDMEGVSGIVDWEQVNGGAPMYEECRKLYTEEINAAVRGARAGGATEIVVVDCHGAGGGWTLQLAGPRAAGPRLRVGGAPRAGPATPGCWSRAATRRCSWACTRRRARPMACSATRSPARRGTTSGSTDVLVGETGINAALCGHWGCPVLLVTGDQATCDEAPRPAGRRADHRGGEAGPRALHGAADPARARAADDRGGGGAGARQSQGGQAVRSREAVRDRD